MDLELLEKAERLYRDGQGQAAYELLAELLRPEPEHARALLDKAVVCHSLGRAEEAVSAFESLLKLDEANLEVRRSFAVTLASLQRWPEAETHLAFILDRRPDDHALLAFLAKVVKAQGRREDALGHIERAVSLAPRPADYADLWAELAGLPKPGQVGKKPRLAVCCAPGLDKFIPEILKGLEPYMRTQAVVSAQAADHLEAIKAANVVWLEGGSPLTEFLSKQLDRLAGKQVLVRLHKHEAHDRLAENIDFSLVSDVIFTAAFPRDLLLARKPEMTGPSRVHVIHHGLDLRKFAFVPRGAGRDIAFLADLSPQNDPLPLLQAFAFLHQRHPEIKLHVAGTFHDSLTGLVMRHFLGEAGLTEAVAFYGTLDRPEDWLKDKDFIFSPGLLASQYAGLLEAMSLGCRPLIYNYPGAGELHPANQLWTTLDDLEDLFLNGPAPEEVSAFVARHYSRARELGGYLKVILDKEVVDEKFEFSTGQIDLSAYQKQIVSYSREGEDILLYKLLSHVQRGFYVDIGCFDWRRDNVGLLFYERGWSGINIDAVPEYLLAYKEHRPRDLNLAAVLSDTDNKPTTMYLLGQLSTLNAENVKRLKQGNNLQFNERQVMTARFDTLVASQPDFTMPAEVHWLKVDVETHEKEVLSGMDWSKFRPWVVMVESTLPNSMIPMHEAFEPILLDNGYSFFLMSDVNRIYLAKEKAEELEANFKKNANLPFCPAR